MVTGSCSNPLTLSDLMHHFLLKNFTKEMESVKLGPNVVAYGAAMAALANGKQWELALKLLDEVGNHGATVLAAVPSRKVECIFPGEKREELASFVSEDA